MIALRAEEQVLVELAARRGRRGALDGTLSVTTARVRWVPRAAAAAAAATAVDIAVPAAAVEIAAQSLTKLFVARSKGMVKLCTRDCGDHIFVFVAEPRVIARSLDDVSSAIRRLIASPHDAMRGASMVERIASAGATLAAQAAADADALAASRAASSSSAAAATTAGGAAAPARRPDSAASRRAMLAADASLKQSYGELVGSGAISEADFWASRSGSLQIDRNDTTRGGGAHDRGGEKGHAEVNVVFTASDIQRIFAAQPTVRAAYANQVPHSISEAEFWTQYTQADHVLRRSSSGGSSAVCSSSSAAAHEYSAGRKQYRRGGVDPSVDLVAHSADRIGVSRSIDSVDAVGAVAAAAAGPPAEGAGGGAAAGGRSEEGAGERASLRKRARRFIDSAGLPRAKLAPEHASETAVGRSLRRAPLLGSTSGAAERAATSRTQRDQYARALRSAAVAPSRSLRSVVHFFCLLPACSSSFCSFLLFSSFFCLPQSRAQHRRCGGPARRGCALRRHGAAGASLLAEEEASAQYQRETKR
jgi:hypothetical protein